jgi:hypothetical protein
MNKSSVVILRALAVILVVAGVFLGAKAYRPAQSGMQTNWSNIMKPRQEPWSKGASVDPMLGGASAGCLAVAVVLLLKRN